MGHRRYKKDPYIYGFFKCMIQRARAYSLPCDFQFGEEGYQKFEKVMGPIPTTMVKPSVGRLDHSLGYTFDEVNNRWNFRWEEHSINVKDGLDKGRKTAVRHQIERGLHPFQNSEIQRRNVAKSNLKQGKLGKRR